MIRRIAPLIAIGALVVAAAFVSLLALDAPTPPPTTLRIDAGGLAVVGDRTWRWTGTSGCASHADNTPIERRQADGPWQESQIPLVKVDSLSFTDDQRGIAVGENGSCAHDVALTSDGGATWQTATDSPALLDAWWVDGRVWGIEQTSEEPTISVYRVRDEDQLLSEDGVNPLLPCDVGDGPASQVAFYARDFGLLLCERESSSSRLLARTTNGETFERLADGRKGYGLNGPAPVRDLDVALPDRAWLQFPDDGTCPEGSLRRSGDQGATWDALPCPSESMSVDKVLDVAFSSATDGMLLGVVDGKAVMGQTSDGGTSWQTVQ